jgi:hypothetical protein
LGVRVSETTGAGRRGTNAAAAREANASAPALRDADAILARATEDEAAAIEARERYRDGGIEPIEPDARIAALLVPGEEVLAVRRSALLDRREPPLGGRPQPGCPGLPGDLYVTSARLVHLGRRQIEFDLASVREAVASGERLLLILCDGAGITFGVDRPRLLRVEIAAARARQAARAGAERNTGPGDGPR